MFPYHHSTSVSPLLTFCNLCNTVNRLTAPGLLSGAFLCTEVSVRVLTRYFLLIMEIFFTGLYTLTNALVKTITGLTKISAPFCFLISSLSHQVFLKIL